MCKTAETLPPIMHHFNGSGSIAYGTNIMNKTYQTNPSRSENPTPSPMKPNIGQKKIQLFVCLFFVY